MLRPVPLLTCLALGLLLAAPASAASKEDTVRAGQIQTSAKEAYEKGELEEALKLASRAISLDAGPSTWLAQQIRVEVLEQQGRTGEALDFVKAYLALQGLFPEHRAWGEEASQRLTGRLRAAREARLRATGAQRGAGAALMVGGAVPLGLGIGFLAQYGSKTSDPLFEGGWYDGFLDGGIAFTALGAGLEVVGIIVAATAASSAPTAQRPGPRLKAAPTFALDGERVVFGLAGRF